MKRALLLAAVVLALPAVAEGRAWPAAHQTPEGSEPFAAFATAAYVEALNYWGLGAPTDSCSTVSRVVAPVLTDYFGGAVGGLTLVPPPWERPSACGIAVQFSSRYNLCVEIFHETGHLLGMGHSGDPSSVMWADPFSANLNVAECRGLAAAWRAVRRAR